MKPVNQIREYDEDGPIGDCYQACLASILELPLAAVPDYLTYWRPGYDAWDKYMDHMQRWLKKHYGLVALTITHDEWPSFLDSVYCIITGKTSEDYNIKHSVVGLGRKMIHDPYPDKAPLIGHWSQWTYEYFIKVDPSQSPNV